MSWMICDRRKNEREGLQEDAETCYGCLETVALTKKKKQEVVLVELKVVRILLGVNKRDRCQNKYIRGTAQVEWAVDKD